MDYELLFWMLIAFLAGKASIAHFFTTADCVEGVRKNVFLEIINFLGTTCFFFIFFYSLCELWFYVKGW